MCAWSCKFESMVIEIDTTRDTPEEISEKIRQAQGRVADAEAAKRRASKLAAFGTVKWEEDALEYQKRLRDEWT